MQGDWSLPCQFLPTRLRARYPYLTSRLSLEYGSGIPVRRSPSPGTVCRSQTCPLRSHRILLLLVLPVLSSSLLFLCIRPGPTSTGAWKRAEQDQDSLAQEGWPAYGVHSLRTLRELSIPFYPTCTSLFLPSLTALVYLILTA